MFQFTRLLYGTENKKKIDTQGERRHCIHCLDGAKHGTRPASGAVRVTVRNQLKGKKGSLKKRSNKNLRLLCFLFCFFNYFATKSSTMLLLWRFCLRLTMTNPWIDLLTFHKLTSREVKLSRQIKDDWKDFDFFTPSQCHVARSTAASLRPFSVQQRKKKGRRNPERMRGAFDFWVRASGARKVLFSCPSSSHGCATKAAPFFWYRSQRTSCLYEAHPLPCSCLSPAQCFTWIFYKKKQEKHGYFFVNTRVGAAMTNNEKRSKKRI